MTKTSFKSLDMTKGPIGPALLAFTLPILFGNLFQQLYTIVDTIIVGRTLGSDALAAVGATGTISFLVVGFATGIASGFAVVTSQRFGAKDEDGIRYSVSNGIILLALIGVVVTILSVLFMRQILTVMNTPENIFEDAYRYITIICLGLLATVFYNLFACLLRAIGNSSVPLYFLVFSSLLNIVLDLVFIISFGWGVAGAAIATIMSQLISAIGSGIYIVMKERSLVPRKDQWRIKSNISIAQIYIGLPMALQYAITASGTMVMQAAVNIFGSIAVAAFSAASKCSMIFTTTYMSIGQSMATYVGQNYGKGDLDRIKKGVRLINIVSAIYSVIAGVLVVWLLPYEMKLFVSDANELASLIPWARTYLIESAIFYIPLGMIFIFRNSMQGYGASMLAMAAGIIEMITRFVCAAFAINLESYAIAVFCDPAAWLSAGIYTMIAFAIGLNRLYDKRKGYNP